jgi:hypothetical protein
MSSVCPGTAADEWFLRTLTSSRSYWTTTPSTNKSTTNSKATGRASKTLRPTALCGRCSNTFAGRSSPRQARDVRFSALPTMPASQLAHPTPPHSLSLYFVTPRPTAVVVHEFVCFFLVSRRTILQGTRGERESVRSKI